MPRAKVGLLEAVAASKKATLAEVLPDYVLAHEVVHLRHQDHGAAFWAALGRVMPDYERRRDRLRTLGRDLVW